ncbi:hypothetical protein BBJ28_00002829 [Nothophytophthora sp. Chile5]|nr:hypothetical protein BBJ28_00002829 [Nothophytophthora sp. Chile5]
MEDMEEIYLRMHAQLVQWFQHLLSAKNRERVELLVFVVASHLLLLCCLLHASFVSPHGHVDCLAQYLPPLAANDSAVGDQFRLLRIQILPEDALWAFDTRFISSRFAADATATNDSHFSALAYHNPATSFIYAPQKALLALLEHAEALQTDVQLDTLSLPRSCPCFELRWAGAPPLWTLVREHVVGYDTILLNQLKTHYGAQGFFYRESSRIVVDMSYGIFNPAAAAQSWLKLVALKFKILHTIVFLFFIITALVAFVLMETQKRMITFTALFQNRLQLQIPFANLVVAYFAQSLMFVPILVGMLFFLFELYKDHLLAFAVMTIMWTGESFSVISVRCRLSQMYFPPLFFCLFTVFHLYLFSFPFGFAYVALGAMTALLAQLMLFFWNCFEIPALNRGEISRICPREPLLLSF